MAETAPLALQVAAPFGIIGYVTSWASPHQQIFQSWTEDTGGARLTASRTGAVEVEVEVGGLRGGVWMPPFIPLPELTCCVCSWADPGRNVRLRLKSRCRCEAVSGKTTSFSACPWCDQQGVLSHQPYHHTGEHTHGLIISQAVLSPGSAGISSSCQLMRSCWMLPQRLLCKASLIDFKSWAELCGVTQVISGFDGTITAWFITSLHQWHKTHLHSPLHTKAAATTATGNTPGGRTCGFTSCWWSALSLNIMTQISVCKPAVTASQCAGADPRSECTPLSVSGCGGGLCWEGGGGRRTRLWMFSLWRSETNRKSVLSLHCVYVKRRCPAPEEVMGSFTGDTKKPRACATAAAGFVCWARGKQRFLCRHCWFEELCRNC